MTIETCEGFWERWELNQNFMPIRHWFLGCLGLLAACSSSSDPVPSDIGPIASTSITGTLGSLGAVQPTASSFVISNSGETLVYLSSGTLTCDQIKVSRWLGSATANSQVIEIVISGAPSTAKTYAVPPSEVNFAQGGKSSATETSADSGSVVFSRADSGGDVEGTLSAAYGSAHITGVFHATFCASGQGY